MTSRRVTEVDKTLGARTLTARAEKWFQRKGPPINVTEGELAGGHEDRRRSRRGVNVCVQWARVASV